MNNIPYLLALHSIDGLGPIRLKALLDHFKDPKLAWEADLRKIRETGVPKNVAELLVETRKSLDPRGYAQSIKDMGIKWLTIFDDNYPKLLKEIYDPPVIFYIKGEILKQDQNAIAIVGTRKMTGYGRVVTKGFVEELVSAGLTIVSGLARGVDTLAHLSAIKNGGRTLAILGGGINNIYPPENIKLVTDIINGKGAVISEFSPDEPSMPGNFPARNRIIAGLSLGVLVTEAAEDSGSLITARLALEEGREVFAVPGPITSNLSAGTSQLIKNGARLVTSTEDILQELGIDLDKGRGKNKRGIADNLSGIEEAILESLENEHKHVDEICRELKTTSANISSALIKLEISGLVKSLGGGNYIKSL